MPYVFAFYTGDRLVCDKKSDALDRLPLARDILLWPILPHCSDCLPPSNGNSCFHLYTLDTPSGWLVDSLNMVGNVGMLHTARFALESRRLSSPLPTYPRSFSLPSVTDFYFEATRKHKRCGCHFSSCIGMSYCLTKCTNFD